MCKCDEKIQYATAVVSRGASTYKYDPKGRTRRIWRTRSYVQSRRTSLLTINTVKEILKNLTQRKNGQCSIGEM